MFALDACGKRGLVAAGYHDGVVDMACKMSRGQSDFLSSFSWFSFSSDFGVACWVGRCGVNDGGSC
jgi:hypothetical protein